MFLKTINQIITSSKLIKVTSSNHLALHFQYNLSSCLWSVRSCMICPLASLLSRVTPTILILIPMLSPHKLHSAPQTYQIHCFLSLHQCYFLYQKSFALDLPHDQFFTIHILAQISLPQRGIPDQSKSNVHSIISYHGILRSLSSL